MIDYGQYKQCMDEARGLSQQAQAVLSDTHLSYLERQKEFHALLGKAEKFRKLAMMHVGVRPLAIRWPIDRTAS